MSGHRKRELYAIVTIILIISLLSLGVNAQIIEDTYEISHSEIIRSVRVGNFAVTNIYLTNKQDTSILATVSLSENLRSYATLSSGTVIVAGNSVNNISITFLGEDLGDFNGYLTLEGGINRQIPINLTIQTLVGLPVEALEIEVTPKNNRVPPGSKLRYSIKVTNLLVTKEYNVTFTYSILKLNQSENKVLIASEEKESYIINNTLAILKEIKIEKDTPIGDYIIEVRADYLNLNLQQAASFTVVIPFYEIKLFGLVAIKYILALLFLIILGIAGFFYYKKKAASKKRYVSKVYYDKLPKPGPRSVLIGKVAESNKKAYFDIDQLMVHTLVAGSTGGGKTVSAEVLVEEALITGAAVVVFDPTAQWTGMLRRNTNKQMFALYPKFGLKKTDARAFNGNIKQILNARELIDIRKYIKPGEITVFAVNQLNPKDIDILVANTIRGVFKANLPESRTLKLIIIFDEVHRLLPKFGGTGQGFVQIERGAREFRKWGVGLMLISQILSDFVGATRANIATEIQMRTRDEGDLDRIKTKYGTFMLQSLLKAATGTGMLENPSYNRGEPYFVSFRPLFHEHSRLSDEELANYNKYNDIIDDLQFQVDQLKEEGIDVFDLQLEVKMALDKVKAGNFNMVNIYLDGLRPRVKDHWKKLGIQPQKRRIQLVSEEELMIEFEKAKKARKKFEEEHVEEKKEVKAELEPLRLKSGLVVMNAQELSDALGNMETKIFSQHVNDQKNDFADWLAPVEKEKADAVREAKSKEDVIKAVPIRGVCFLSN